MTNILVMLAIGCGEKEPVNPIYFDLDGDGYTEEIDCDEQSAEINPGAAEVCDGVDNDCDGLVDDEDDSVTLLSWYVDADNDGFGSAEAGTGCEGESGWAELAGDCDDANPDLHPQATEICDGVDNDCDELVDDADDSVMANERWYADADADGFGDPTSSLQACDRPNGYTENELDCNDNESAISPLAIEECDGIDTDCDGLVDADDPDIIACDECTEVNAQSDFGVVLSEYSSPGDVANLSCETGQPDTIVRWMPPATGQLMLQSSGPISQVDGCDGGTAGSELECSSDGALVVDVVLNQEVHFALSGEQVSLEILASTELSCGNGLDEDQDGFFDCDDELDCWFDAQCGASQCPNFTLVDPVQFNPVSGAEVLSTSLFVADDSIQPSCTGSGLADIQYEYLPSAVGCLQVFASSDDAPVSLSALDSCGGTELSCNESSSVTTGIYGTDFGSYLELDVDPQMPILLVVEGSHSAYDQRFALGLELNTTVNCAGDPIQ